MPDAPRKRLALVVPRFGADIRGGAEKLAYELSQRLASSASVDVVTTCATDYRTWSDVYTPGETVEGNARILRFRVDRPRSVNAFDRLSVRIAERADSLSVAEQEQWMRAQGPVSSELLAFIDAHRHDYDAWIFLPYLYATTYFGLPLVGKKSVLIPLAHDEWPLRMSEWDRIFQIAGARIYMTEEEQALVGNRFGAGSSLGIVGGSGVDTAAGDASRFRSRFPVAPRVLLYVGRIDESKGCAELVRDFLERGRSGESLVLAGPQHGRRPSGRNVILTGELDEQAKWDAFDAADAVVVPSRYESLSYAALEAWSCAKPVLVNARSAVLVAHCRRGNGGLWYRNAAEFSAALDAIYGPAGRTLGLQGQRYVRDHFSWARTLAAVSAAVEEVAISLPTGY